MRTIQYKATSENSEFPKINAEKPHEIKAGFSGNEIFGGCHKA
jgi:hypothetical protein